MKKIYILLLSFLFVFALIGCDSQNLEEIGTSPVEMQNVTERDSSTDIVYSLSVPKDWVCAVNDAVIMTGFSDAKDQSDINSYLTINRYLNRDPSDEEKKIYQELFEGKTKKFEKWIEETGNEANILVPFDYHNSYSDFHYKSYQGNYGQILEVRYKIVYESSELSSPETTQVLSYYRKDIPYLATVTLDSSSLSPDAHITRPFDSEDVALYIINSLQIEGT